MKIVMSCLAHCFLTGLFCAWWHPTYRGECKYRSHWVNLWNRSTRRLRSQRNTQPCYTGYRGNPL